MRSTLRFSVLRPRVVCLALGAAATAALAADVLPEAQCSGGVCMANIDAKASIEPCGNANLVLAWSQGGKAIAVQCMTDVAPMDQPLVVFERRNLEAPAWELTGIRAFLPETLPQLAHVPGDGNDALLPACRRPNPPTMATGELLLTEKVPSDNERHPYCYRVLRVASTAAGIAIRADDGKAPAAARLDPEWHALAAKMMAIVMAADARTTLRVTRARAPLRDTSDPKAAPHGFLVAGGRVHVIDRDTPSGMVRVVYENAKGISITRWMAQADIAP